MRVRGTPDQIARRIELHSRISDPTLSDDERREARAEIADLQSQGVGQAQHDEDDGENALLTELLARIS